MLSSYSNALLSFVSLLRICSYEPEYRASPLIEISPYSYTHISNRIGSCSYEKVGWPAWAVARSRQAGSKFLTWALHHTTRVGIVSAAHVWIPKGFEFSEMNDFWLGRQARFIPYEQNLKSEPEIWPGNQGDLPPYEQSLRLAVVAAWSKMNCLFEQISRRHLHLCLHIVISIFVLLSFCMLYSVYFSCFGLTLSFVNLFF